MIRKPYHAALLLGMIFCLISTARGAEEQTGEYSVVGLFSPEREQDLRDALADAPELQLVHLDYANALATFRYDLKSIFPNLNPKKPPTPAEVQQQLSKLLAQASNNTFTLSPGPAIAKDKLTKIEMTVGICDCKGCRYAAYLLAMKVEGVEQATVSKDSLLTAWIDPSKTNPAALEAALKKANVEKVAKP